MTNSTFYDYMFEVMEYELSDAAPYGYFQDALIEELKSKEVMQTFINHLNDLMFEVAENNGEISDAGERKYNAGAYFLAKVPIEIGDAIYSLYPSLLGNGWGEIEPHMGIAVSGFGFPNDYFDPKSFGLPQEAYFKFIGDFIAPSSMMDFPPKTNEFFLTQFLGLASRGLAAAILMCGLIEFRSQKENLNEHLLNLWNHFLKSLQDTVDKLEV